MTSRAFRPTRHPSLHVGFSFTRKGFSLRSNPTSPHSSPHRPAIRRLTSQSTLDNLPVTRVAQEIRIPRSIRVLLVLSSIRVMLRLRGGRQVRFAILLSCRRGDGRGRGVDRDTVFLGGRGELFVCWGTHGDGCMYGMNKESRGDENRSL